MTQDATHEVIVHVSDGPGDVQRALDAAAGLRAADPSVRVQVIVNGEALTAFTGPVALEVPAGAELTACETGLARRGVDRADLPPVARSTPSAVVAIVEAQRAGAAYVRL